MRKAGRYRPKVFSLSVTQTAQNPDNSEHLPASADALPTSGDAGNSLQLGQGIDPYKFTVFKEPIGSVLSHQSGKWQLS
jgi:hypothetical protein